MLKQKKHYLLSLLALALLGLHGCAALMADSDEADRDPASYQEKSDKVDCDTEECDEPKRVITHRDFTDNENSDTENPVQVEKIRIRDAIEARDVVLGMTRQDVLQSWGEPSVRELAGRGIDGHERWHYGSRYSLKRERIVIFENGEVAGWY